MNESVRGVDSGCVFQSRAGLARHLGRALRGLCLLGLLLAASTGLAQTATQPPGAGTQGSPYEISTLDHLFWIASSSTSFASFTYFIQTADIDASDTTNWYDGQGWRPINASRSDFIKLYDGQGHTISGLKIDVYEITTTNGWGREGCAGLFGVVSGGEIRSLGLVNADISLGFGSYVGALAGQCVGTKIQDCYATGVVQGGQVQAVGGLLGMVYLGSLVERCYFDGVVQSTSTLNSPQSVGGLVGILEAGDLRDCYAVGVFGYQCDSSLGGLVGRADHAYSDALRTDVAGTIENCYVACDLDVHYNGIEFGAFIGDMRMGFENAYTTQVVNSFYDLELEDFIDWTAGDAIGTNTAAMKTQATFTGWDFGTVWGLAPDRNNGYPYLKAPSYAVVPTLTTAVITNFGTTTASGGGEITDLGGEAATQHGLCWSTSPGPTTAGSKTSLGAASATGSFTSSIASLSYGTKYYVRAYAVNSAGTGYGNEINFTTLSHADAVAAAKTALEIGYASGDTADSVTQDVTLPLDGAYDCDVSWASDDPTVILVEGGGGPSSVFRPLSSDGDATVELTATITSGSASDTRVFTVTVKAEAITLSEGMIEEILPGKLHVDGNKRLTLVGRNFRAYVNKGVIDFSVTKGGWTGPIAAEDIRVVSDQLMTIVVPVNESSSLGAYTLHLDHDSLQDLSLSDAFEVTDDPADRAQTIQEIVMTSANPDVEVQSLSIKGAFEEELPGCYKIAGEGQTVLFNSYLMLEVEGDDLTVDTRAGRKRITGSGRFTVNAENDAGKASTATLYDGAFELEEFDMEFVFGDDPTLLDHLGIGMEVGPKSMVFTQDGEDIGLSMQGIMNAGFNFFGRVGAEVNVDEVLVSLEGFDLVASLGVEANFEIAGFDSPRLALGIDTTVPEYSFGCGATIPKLSEKYGFDLDFTIRKGKLQSIAFLIRAEIEMPQFGSKITAFGGGVENLADQSRAPLTVRARGQVSDMVAPELFGNSFLNADLTLGVSAYHLEATGEADIYGLLDIGSAQFVLIWDPSGHPRYSNRGFQFEGNVDILSAIVGELLANYWENQGFSGELDVAVEIPDYVPLVGGIELDHMYIYTDQYKASVSRSIIGIPVEIGYRYREESLTFAVDGFAVLEQIGEALVKFGEMVYEFAMEIGRLAQAAFNAVSELATEAYGYVSEAITQAAKAAVETAVRVAEAVAAAAEEAVAAAAEAAQAIADAAEEAWSAVEDAAEEAWDDVCDFFCEEGRNALSVYVEAEGNALIEVRGLVSSDLAIQAPDYYTLYPTNKSAATRYFRADSGYPISHPGSTATVTLVDYDANTGAGNMLYLPAEKKAYVVLNLNQVGSWNFIDWNWINVYTNADVRSNVTAYAGVKIYRLTPGLTLDYVVKNMLVTNAPGAVLDLTAAATNSGMTRFLFSIASDSEKVSIYRPAGGAYPLQLDRHQDDWNAVFIEGAGKFYAVVEPGDELAGWRITSDGHSEARAMGTTNDIRSLLESLVNSGLRTDFRLTADDVASGKVMIALGSATDTCSLYRPDGVPVPLVFEGAGRNADYQADYDIVYVLANVTGAHTGLWHAVAEQAVKPHVLALDAASTMDAMLAMLAASPDIVRSTVTLGYAGPWLLRASGVAGTNGIVVRDPAGQVVAPPMLITNEFGTPTLYVRVDTTADTRGDWVFTATNPLPLQVDWIAEPALTLAELAARYQGGTPYTFTLELTSIGRRVFEVELAIPPSKQAGFDFATIRDDITIYRPDGTTVALEFNEASPNWNAFYHAATSNLYLMTDALNVGWWHLSVPYGRHCTTWITTGDPALTMSRFQDVAAGAVPSVSYPRLPKVGYYLLEIQGGDASTVIYRPDPVSNMVYHVVAQTPDNARQVGDTLYVLVESAGLSDGWKITSDRQITLSAAYLDQTTPGVLSLADVLDSPVTTKLNLPAHTRWAVEIRSLTNSGAAAAVSLARPDGTNYVIEFLPPDGFDHAEDYPTANARYVAETKAMTLSIEAEQGGAWLLTTPGRQAFSLYQLGFMPSVETFTFAAVPGETENLYDVTWKIAHPAAGSVVSVTLVSEADLQAGQRLGRELADGLNTFGTTRVQVPEGLMPGRYYFVLVVSAPKAGMMMEAAAEAITVSYRSSPPAPTNLRLDSVGNGEIVVLFDDYNYFGANRYVVMTHQVRSNEAASAVGVMRFNGATMAQIPDAGSGNGVGQRVTLAGLLPGQTNLIALCAVVGEAESSQFSLPSDILEVYLPEPDRPDLGLGVTVGAGYQASAGFYTNYFLYQEVVTNENGRPVMLPGTNVYETVWRTNAVIERSALINADAASLVASVSDGQTCTFEAFLDDVSVGTVLTPATQAVFALTGLAEGSYAVEVVAVNVGGDRRREALQLQVDRTAPYLELFSPLSGLALYNTTVKLIGQTEAGVSLFLNSNDVSSVVGSDGRFTNTMSGLATNTLHAFILQASDAAGNVASRRVQAFVVSVDTSLYPVDNADLIGIEIENGTLNQTFRSKTTNGYTIAVTSSRIRLAPTAFSPGATVLISVNGGDFEEIDLLDPQEIALAPGSNTLVVRVRAQDGTTIREYTFTAEGGLPEYTVTASVSGAGGQAIPMEPQTVESNRVASFEVFPDRGYLIDAEVGGTASLGGWTNGVWTTGPITQDSTVIFGFTGGGVIELATNAPVFTATYLDATNPPDQTLVMSNRGTGVFYWTNRVAYSAGAADWLSVLPGSGSTAIGGETLFTHAADVAGLNAGSYAATVTVESATATNAPQSYVVRLTVAKAAQTIQFDNPGKQIITNVTPLVATATPSGLPVAFASTIGLVQLSSFLSPANATYTGGGKVTIVAGQGGNSNWFAAAAVTQSFWVSAVVWVSEPAARGSYSNALNHGVYATEVVNALPVSYWTDDLPAWLTLTNLDLIETLAGKGEVGFSGDGGPATNATLGFPGSVKAGADGSIYFTDDGNHRVRRMDTNGVVQTVAGNGATGYSGDGGAATDAALNWPMSVALDDEGNLYIADFSAHVVRRVGTNGIISTVAGTGTAGYGGDGGSASDALLSGPSSVCVHGGRLYIADQFNSRVRVVDALGDIHTLAGNGDFGYSGDGGPATEAALLYPTSVAVAPDGRVLIADRYNNRIRAVATNGVITTFAGTGEYGFGGDGGAATNALLNYPRGVAVDDLGRVFIADTENARLRMVATNGLIRTLAGTGNYGFSGDGGPALAAMLDGPAGIDVDATRGILFADLNNQRIRRVRLSAGLLQGIPQETGVFPMTLWAADGVTSNDQAFVLTIEKAYATITLSNLNHTYDGTAKTPTCATAPSGLVVQLTYNGVTNLPVNAGSYAVTALVVEANWQGSNTASLVIQKAAQTINFPAIGDQVLSNRVGLAATVTNSGYAATFAVAAGHAGVAGGTNLSFQRVGPVSIVASRAGDANYLAALPVTNSFMVYSPPVWSAEPVTNAVCGTPYRYRLVAHDPDSWTVDFGGTFTNLFALETNVDERVVHAVAGTGAGDYDGEGAFATNHAVYRPSNVSLTSNGYVYVADQYNHRIRRIAPDGYIETVAGTGLPGSLGDGGAATNAQLRFPADSVQDAEGNLYIADRDNHRIRKVDAGGTIRTIAGTGLPGFSGEGGMATNAALNFPAGLALDEAGAHLYIADRDNHRIRRLSLADQTITTVAGSGLPGDAGDGAAATSARLRNPTDIVLDGEGNLYVADQNNHKVRRVDTNGVMATVAGTGVFGYSGDGGSATNAALNKPYGVALDGVGRLYISDTDNHRIRQVVLSNGVIRTLAGTGSAGYNGDEILGTNAQFNAPYGVAADALGHVFIADNNNQRIRRLDVGSVYLGSSTATSGLYPVELSATDGDQHVTWQTFTIEVVKAEASVFLGSLVQTYDGTARSLTATTMPGGLTVTFTYDGGDTAPVDAGSYAVTGTVDDTCYRGSASGTLVVNKADQIAAINFTPVSPQTYRTTNALEATGGSGTGMLTFAVVDGPGVLEDGTNLVVTSGTGTVLVRATRNEDRNWKAASVTGSVTAAKADQTISFPAIDDQKTTNKVGLAASASSGLPVSFDISSGLAQITGGTNLSFTGAGEVSIVASQAGDTNWNAAARATNTFTVTKAEAGVTLHDLSATYDGTAKPATASTVPSGLTVEFTYNGISSAPVNAGSYAVTGTVNDVMYMGAATGELVIAKAEARVYLENTNQVYDGAAKSVMVTTDPSGLTVIITYEGGSLAPSNAGSYGVTALVNETNWQGGITGSLVIVRGLDTIAFSNTNQTYDGTIRIVTAVAGSGAPVSLTYNGSPSAPVNAGVYVVTGVVDAANWSATGVTALTVGKASQTVDFAALPPQRLTNVVGLAATALSGLPVTFAVTSGPGVLTGGTNLSFTSTGVVSVVASQAGNTNWNSAQASVNIRVQNEVPLDFDGDGITDLGVLRRTNMAWFVWQTSAGGMTPVQFGLIGDIPVPADYDGDGRSDVAVFRPSTAAWYIFGSTSGGWAPIVYGMPGDTPIPADYDGDGRADLAVCGAVNRIWSRFGSKVGPMPAFQYGATGDMPIPADYDGDGRADAAVFRPANSTWYIFGTTRGAMPSVAFGMTGDLPVPGDYDGDGRIDYGVFRPSNVTWYLFGSRRGAIPPFTYGAYGDVPLLQPGRR